MEKLNKRFIISNTLSTFLHEMGHALIHDYEIPVLGKEEDACDNFQTYYLIVTKDYNSYYQNNYDYYLKFFHGILEDTADYWFYYHANKIDIHENPFGSHSSTIERYNRKFIFFSNSNRIYSKLQSICINIRYKKTIDTNNILIKDKTIDNYLCSTINIKKFKELSYILSCLNIPYCIILKILLYDIIDKFEITNDKKYKCIKFLCDIQHKYINGYNKIFYYEYLFLNLYNILFNT